MNPEARTRLDELLATEPNSLTPEDIEFLRARSSYLSEEQKHMLKQFETAKKEETEQPVDNDLVEGAGSLDEGKSKKVKK